MAVNLFDANFYRTANPDLGRAGLTTDALLTSHFENFGLNEGRQFSLFTNLNFYRASNPDLAGLNNRQAYEHLRNFGVREGRQFSPFVDINFYLSANPDVNTAYRGDKEQSFGHLQNIGLNEGRKLSAFVNIPLYKALNLDLADLNWTNRQLFEHLQLNGLKEGRLFDDFVDLNVYLNANPDVNRVYQGNRELALQHLETLGVNEGRTFSRFFDVNYYKSNNADLRAANFSGKQLFNHFELSGLTEGRPGRSDFAGNSLNTATNITIDSSLNYYIDYVGPSDADDYYRFVLNRTSTLITIAGKFGTSDVFGELLNSNGQVLQSANYTSNTLNDVDIFTTLQPGTYYLHLKPVSGGTNYTFVALTA